MLPAILALAYSVLPEAKRAHWSKHNVGYILLYIYFGLWAISSFWVIYDFIWSIIRLNVSIWYIFLFIGQCFFVLDNLACFFLFYSYRKDAPEAAPLVESQAYEGQ